jgi:hypothetical protein
MRNADDRDPRPVLTCSLCGKSQHDVSDLSGGPAAFVREFVCHECIRLELAKLENPIPALSQSLDHSLRRAVALAGRLSDEGVTPEYLLLALTDDPDAVPVMQACDVDLEKLRGAVFASMSAPDGGPLPNGTVPRTSQSFQADTVLLEGVSLSVGPKDYRSVKKGIENAALVTRPEGSSFHPRGDLRNVEVSKAQRGGPSADRSHRFKPSHERSEPCGLLHHTHWIGSHRNAVLY